MKYKTLEEIQQNPVWLKLQSQGIDKKQLMQNQGPCAPVPGIWLWALWAHL